MSTLCSHTESILDHADKSTHRTMKSLPCKRYADNVKSNTKDCSPSPADMSEMDKNSGMYKNNTISSLAYKQKTITSVYI